MRALVVSNMLPDAAHPERGSFVRDQVAAVRELDDLEVELYEFPPGGGALARAGVDLARRRRAAAPDIVHAHFGLTALPSLSAPARVRGLTLHGTDVRHPRTRLVTRAVAHSVEVLGVVSRALAQELPARLAGRAVELPCGVDVRRFSPRPRREARERLGLDPGEPFALFPADPARAGKRHDRALELTRAAGVRLAVLGGVAPERVPLWVNAANAVLVPSDHEGFGLAAVEALACEVPVLATPVGIHAAALAGIDGALCAPFALETWLPALRACVLDPDPRAQGRASAERFSAVAMAHRLRDAWREALQRAA
ncbi:MAG TPA: glycosyltransferase [Solirubrobacteraceae bacterium]|nr:glycosyltransferase [Solirubrobacteraceae bacterium]